MEILSLFDGMGCLYMALKELGIQVTNYYASEIEKKPIEFTKQNIPEVEHLGDINKWREWDIDWSKIKLIGAGSPCQGFSFAGKQLNFSDERSKLFFVFIEILNHVRKFNSDVKYLLENVNMKKEYLRIISEYVGVFPVRINSNLVSAQNRDRWYWTNIRTKETGLFSELWTDIPQPQDKGILLKDVLQPENEIEDKYYLSDNMHNFIKKRDKENYGKRGLSHKSLGYDKSKCLTTGKLRDSSATFICIAMRGRNIVDGKRKDYKGAPTEQRLEPNTEGKTNCLTSVAKDNLLTDGYKLRRLTPTECARLQTIPEWVNFDGFSDTAIYKMLGNGWTVDVIKHILSYM